MDHSGMNNSIIILGRTSWHYSSWYIEISTWLTECVTASSCFTGARCFCHSFALMEAGTVVPYSQPDEHTGRNCHSKIPYNIRPFSPLTLITAICSKNLLVKNYENLYCNFTFVWWCISTSHITALVYPDSEITDHSLYSVAPIHWILLGWGGKAQGSMSYEVCACLNVQEANETHKSQIQCQLEQ
jgi:hypothetical protein